MKFWSPAVGALLESEGGVLQFTASDAALMILVLIELAVRDEDSRLKTVLYIATHIAGF